MRMTSEVETNIVAVERIKEYCETPQVRFLQLSTASTQFAKQELVSVC